jgi:thiol-disulfide isomerase/thioredoxin
MSRVLKVVLLAGAVPVAAGAYIVIAGLTGFCPACEGIVCAVRGDAKDEPARAAALPDLGSVDELTGFTLYGLGATFVQYRGKPIIIEVWSTTCAPCLQQRKIFEDLGTRFRRDTSLISMSVDRDPEVVLKFLEDHPMSPVELMATPESIEILKVKEVPTLVFVDAKGRIRAIETGVHTADDLRRMVAALNAG